MRSLILLRHGVTRGNEEHLYYGSTDLPLSGAGRDQALHMKETRPLPACELAITTDLRRTEETLLLLTGRKPDRILPDLREMDFGAFEMRGYEALRHEADYIRWIEDDTGDVPCPGGESRNAFLSRVLRGGEALLKLDGDSAIVVCHGGVIASLMQTWFPGEGLNFYEWQPAACEGYQIQVVRQTPVGYTKI